jgi:hypothetical protein
MKIISNYKDYYDHVAYQYGVDPLIVYKRQPFSHDADLHKYICDQLHYISCYFPTRHIRPKDCEHQFKWLCINAKLYLLAADNIHAAYKVVTPEIYKQLMSKGSKFELGSSWSRRHYPYSSGYDYYIGNDRVYNELIEVSCKLNTPVFEITETHFGHYIPETNKCRVPTLSELGVASVIPPEKMFQELSYFIGNIMKDTPDVKPPVVIDNDLRIEGHGFDLKQSFRHRCGTN